MINSKVINFFSKFFLIFCVALVLILVLLDLVSYFDLNIGIIGAMLLELLPMFVLVLLGTMPFWVPILNLIMFALWVFITVNEFSKKEISILLPICSVITVILWTIQFKYTNFWMISHFWFLGITHFSLSKIFTKKEFLTVIIRTVITLGLFVILMKIFSEMTSGFPN